MNIIIKCGDPTKLIEISSHVLQSHFYPERYRLHPKLQVEYIENLIKESFVKSTITIITNSDAIINRCRVAKKQKEIKDLKIEFYPFEHDRMVTISVDKNGTLNEYPKDFIDQGVIQLMNLL